MLEKVELGGKVEVANEVNGIEMGVLTGGSAYLTGHGVARLCDVAISTIINQKNEWSAGKRNNKFAKMLQARGYDEPELFVPIKHRGQDAHAYHEVVCMTFLEYFAFESPSKSKQAEVAFRKLGIAGLRIFVYNALGYTLTETAPSEWRKFHDRMLLATAPIGYFSVFKEIADFVLAAIRGGLVADEATIPDISVGQTWSTFWQDNGLAARHGDRIKHEHNYPDHFPQARSNPQEIWVYPVQALGDFRIWLQREYIPQKFSKYLSGKVKLGLMTTSTAEMLVAHATHPEPVALPK